MHSATRDMDVTPSGQDRGVAFYSDLNLTVQHEKRFVPRMKVGWRPSTLHAFLNMHFERFGAVSTRQNRHVLSDNFDRLWRSFGFDYVNCSHFYPSAGSFRINHHKSLMTIRLNER